MRWLHTSIQATLASALLILTLGLETACSLLPPVDSVGDAIVVTSESIRRAAVNLKDACGNTVPDGPCAEGSSVSTATKQRLKGVLQEAAAAVQTADDMLEANDVVGAEGQLARARALLAVVHHEIGESA